jgi:hypothetical protein
MARDAKAEHIHGFHYYFVGAASLLRLRLAAPGTNAESWWVGGLVG